MTAERDFIRKHPDTSPKAMIALASHAGLTITSRLIGKVRYYDRKKQREAERTKIVGPLDAVLKAAKRVSTQKKTSKPVTMLTAFVAACPKERSVIMRAMTAVSTLPEIEHKFIVLADEIGYERSCELLDLWRESVRRVQASL